MTVLTRTPVNTGLLQETKFQLFIPGMNNMIFFCTKANLPGCSIDVNSQPTPLMNIPRAGSKLEHEPLNITFIVDENLAAWREVYSWIENMAPPARPFQKPDWQKYHNAILTFYTNLNNPNLRVKFFKLFPVSLSSVEMDTGGSAETTLSATATFRFDYFEFADQPGSENTEA